MEPTSHPRNSSTNLRILESQLRDSYGKVVYSHKTHEKAADIILDRLSRAKIIYIALSAISAGGFASDLLFTQTAGSLIGGICSAGLLAVNLFTKDRDWAALAQRHRQAASDIWLIRERYLSLIADLVGGLRPADKLLGMRDQLVDDLHSIYKESPSTNSQAYNRARKALKIDGELTFSDKELDQILPGDLRRGQQ